MLQNDLLQITRIRVVRICVALSAMLLATSLVLAQGGRNLQPGVPVNGALDGSNPAQVYTYTSSADNETVNLGLTAQPGLALTILVTDAGGNAVGRAADTTAAGSVSLVGLSLPTAGTYYVTIFPTAGVATVSVGAFRLTLDTGETVTEGQATAEPTAESAATDASPEPTSETVQPTATQAVEQTATQAVVNFQPGQVLTTSGVEVSLSWNTSSDLNLQVRDPVGQTLFYDSRLTTNGGTFGFDVNGLCEVLTPENAEETATWSPGAVATGSYEILVYYRQDCESSGPVEFTINTTVDGQPLAAVSATLPAPINNVVPVYLTSFRINADGTAVLGADGQYQDTRVLPIPAADLLAQPAQPVEAGVPIRDVITSSQYYKLYSFEGVAGDTYSISMSRAEGSLDTLLLVFDQNGQIVADNDDVVAADNTNSAISNPPLRLPVTGRYTIMATRYGKDVGGTEGIYDLLLDAATVQLPEDVANLNLPNGDIEVTLLWNTSADLQLLVRDNAGDSVFDDRVQIPSGGLLSAIGNRNCVTAATTPVSYIYWPTGLARGGSYEVEVWYQNQCNDTRPVVANLYVTVRGQLVINETIAGIEPDTRYLITFVIDPTTATVTPGDGGILGGSETLVEFQNEVPTAFELLSGAAPARGTISQDNKYDVFIFSGEAGQVATIDLQATSGSLDTVLFLIGPSGLELAQNDDAVVNETTDSRIADFVLPETGQYVVLATHYGTVFGGTTGTYALSLTLE